MIVNNTVPPTLNRLFSNIFILYIWNIPNSRFMSIICIYLDIILREWCILSILYDIVQCTKGYCTFFSTLNLFFIRFFLYCHCIFSCLNNIDLKFFRNVCVVILSLMRNKIKHIVNYYIYK